MTDIQVLSSSVIDKIAAGEVLEKPAQLVKELVENSLDAEASEVEVEISDGGRSVRVRDDGKGIPAEQMELALRRHATSKIQKVEDLFALSSFGFRGEALSSAAAVSHLVLTSRMRGEEQGYRLDAVFGEMKPKVEVSSPVGSEIRVSGLFDNVPARKKFLKSDNSEFAQIKLCLKSFGLSRPDVKFKLSRNGELVYFWPETASKLQRAKDVLDIDQLFETRHEENDIRVEAFFAAPNVTLRQNRGIWIFVQGRWIQDRALSAAIMEAYRNLLMHGEYPHCVLFVDLPAEDVDVNVHPAKSQVKFAKPSDVFRAVVHALRNSLQETPWLRSRNTQPPPSFVPSEGEESPREQITFLDRELKKTQLQKKDFSGGRILRDSGGSSPVIFPKIEDLERAAQVETVRSPSSTSFSAPETDFRWGDLQVIGQMGQTYIVAQSAEDFYLVDQHAAHERVVFERLMRDWKNGRFVKQDFLIPLHVDFSADEVEELMRHKEDLEKLGLTVEQAGPETVAITSVPELIKESGVAKALRVFADQLSKFSGSFAVERAIADIFASMSCHSVVRAGQSLSQEEMASLLGQMDEFPFSSFCPHGRPVYIKKSFHQIEREFGRII